MPHVIINYILFVISRCPFVLLRAPCLVSLWSAYFCAEVLPLCGLGAAQGLSPSAFADVPGPQRWQWKHRGFSYVTYIYNIYICYVSLLEGKWRFNLNNRSTPNHQSHALFSIETTVLPCSTPF